MPIWFIIWMLAGFAWLGYEIYKYPNYIEVLQPKYARYEVYHALKSHTLGHTPLLEGGNLPEDYSPNGEPCYTIVLSPGIDGVLCGYTWLDNHCADLVDYEPEVNMHIGGVRYSMHIKQPSIIKDIMRVNKLTKKQKLAYV